MKAMHFKVAGDPGSTKLTTLSLSVGRAPTTQSSLLGSIHS